MLQDEKDQHTGPRQPRGKHSEPGHIERNDIKVTFEQQGRQQRHQAQRIRSHPGRRLEAVPSRTKNPVATIAISVRCASAIRVSGTGERIRASPAPEARSM